MLTEGDKLEEWAINLINDYEASKQYSSSEPKRIARFSGEIVANPEAYYELFDLARSQDLTGKELVQTIRSIEDLLLGAKQKIQNPKIRTMVDAMSWNPTDRRQLISDVVHHLYAQRTGGDTLRRLSQKERKIGRNIIREAGFEWGNVPKNLKSLFRSWHTKKEKPVGAERLAMQRFGAESVMDLPTEKVHDKLPINVTSTIKGATTGREAAFGVGEDYGMLEQMAQQEFRNEQVFGELDPTQKAVDEILGGDYDIESSGEILEARRTKGVEKVEDLANVFEKDFGRLVQKFGQVKFNANLLGVLPIVGTALGAATVESAAQAREEEIKQRPDDPTLKINKALDIAAGYGDRLSLAGMATSATGIGAVVGAPMVAIGEGISLAAGAGSISLDFSRFMVDELKRGPQQIRGRSGAKRAIEEDKVLN